MPHTFLKHSIGKAERLWIAEAETLERYDARVLKKRLFGKLPKDFSPYQIDGRIWNRGEFTLAGYRLLKPKDPILADVDSVIRAIRQRIHDEEGVQVVTAEMMSAATKLPEKRVRTCFGHILSLGAFGQQGGRAQENFNEFISIALTGEDTYDGYLGYTTLDDALEFAFTRQEREQAAHKKAAEMGGAAALDLWGDGTDAPVKPPIRRNTAFILMPMDKSNPLLTDVLTAIKETCKKFGIDARRADEILHQEKITDVVLNRIETCEHLIADLTHERPNVYYEIGYAHALGKYPILIRREGTQSHFDLSVHNTIDYQNATELRELLTTTLQAKLGRKPKK